MPQIEETVLALEKFFNEVRENRRKREAVIQEHNPAELEAMMLDAIEKYIDRWQQNIREELHKLLRFPPHFVEHFERLKIFRQQSPYDQSVFIMTKFPDSKSKADEPLTKVINAVKKAVTDCGFFPRIANDRGEQNPLLWKNVELYRLGCRQGIAIVEDKYNAEFNPNVALEWGWMRAMNKPVLYLIEESFSHTRADVAGYISHDFPWNDPEADITKYQRYRLGGGDRLVPFLSRSQGVERDDRARG